MCRSKMVENTGSPALQVDDNEESSSTSEKSEILGFFLIFSFQESPRNGQTQNPQTGLGEKGVLNLCDKHL